MTHVYAHSPHHLPKKVTEKPSVNHIGSSDEPPMISKETGATGAVVDMSGNVNARCFFSHIFEDNWPKNSLIIPNIFTLTELVISKEFVYTGEASPIYTNSLLSV